MGWISRGLLFAGALALSLPASAAAQTTAPWPELDCSRPNGATGRFQSGSSDARRCAVEYLAEMRRFTLFASVPGTHDPWPALVEATTRLSDYYLARSDRQQAFLDTGAGATGFGATGAVLSTAAGAQTVRLWTYGALLPVILVNFNANEPTRDLYFAGHIGLQLIMDRYGRLHNKLHMLSSGLGGGTTGVLPCEEVEQHLSEAESWPAGEDKTAFLPVLSQAAATCREIIAGENQLRTLEQTARLLSREWPAGLVTDALRLEAVMNDRDNRLRTTPTRAFTTAIVAPLRAVDTLLSGQDTQEALNELATNEALDDTVILLHQIDLPTVPSPVTSAIYYPGALQTRAAITRPAPASGQSRTTPTDLSVRSVNAWLRVNLSTIERARLDLNARLALANDLRSAASQSQLAFDYAVGSSQINVQIEPRGTTTTRTAPPETSSTPPVDQTPPVQAPPSPAEPPK